MSGDENPSAAPATAQMLAGLRVIDLGTMISGPVCCTLFADFGAEVIKVEMPGRGDTVRHLGPFQNGECLYWQVENRGKKSVTIDLHLPEGRQLLCELVQQADAVVENFRPGTLEAWGVGYEVLRAYKPDLIMLRISGFGQTGPYSKRAGYDRIALAFGGLMGITGYPDRPPVRSGTSTADYQTALLGAFALMMAIYHRDRGGGGQEIDLAMYEAVVRFTEVLLPEYSQLGVNRVRRGNKHFAAAPGEHYLCADGRYLILTISADAGFHRLCAAMQRPDLSANPDYATHAARWENIDALNGIVAEWVLSQPVAGVTGALDGAKLAYSFIFTVEDIFDDPHYAARGSIATMQHPRTGPLRMAGIFPKFSGVAARSLEPAPDLGQHNDEILGELLGRTSEELAALKALGAI